MSGVIVKFHTKPETSLLAPETNLNVNENGNLVSCKTAGRNIKYFMNNNAVKFGSNVLRVE